MVEQISLYGSTGFIGSNFSKLESLQIDKSQFFMSGKISLIEKLSTLNLNMLQSELLPPCEFCAVKKSNPHWSIICACTLKANRTNKNRGGVSC